MNTYKWDPEEFLFFEKLVPGIYSYIDKFYDDDTKTLGEIYETIIRWMKWGWRPKDIQGITLKSYYAFGKEGFFKHDIETINNWCSTMRILDYKIRHNEELFLSKSTGKDAEFEHDAEEIREKWALF